jgi:septal ring factor EnvC (AmiA/AmiB activator)
MKTLVSAVIFTMLLFSPVLAQDDEAIVNPYEVQLGDLEQQQRDLRDEIAGLDQQEMQLKAQIEDLKGQLKRAQLELKELGISQKNANARMKDIKKDTNALKKLEKNWKRTEKVKAKAAKQNN